MCANDLGMGFLDPVKCCGLSPREMELALVDEHSPVAVENEGLFP